MSDGAIPAKTRPTKYAIKGKQLGNREHGATPERILFHFPKVDEAEQHSWRWRQTGSLEIQVCAWDGPTLAGVIFQGALVPRVPCSGTAASLQWAASPFPYRVSTHREKIKENGREATKTTPAP